MDQTACTPAPTCVSCEETASETGTCAQFEEFVDRLFFFYRLFSEREWTADASYRQDQQGTAYTGERAREVARGRLEPSCGGLKEGQTVLFCTDLGCYSS